MEFLLFMGFLASLSIWCYISPKLKERREHLSSYSSSMIIGKGILVDNINKQYEIGYFDAKGEETKRTITLHKITLGADNSEYIETYCHLRKEPRTFRIDRISQIIDLQTGEVADTPSQLFAQLIIDTLQTNR